MKQAIFLLLTLLSLNFSFNVMAEDDKVTLKILSKTNTLHSGFVGHIYDEKHNKLYLKIDNIDSEFIYQSSLPQGLGSNDIGLDRGQLSEVRLVEFNRVGDKLFLHQKNTKYRAVSSNIQESLSVDEAFASAILWSFPIVETHKNWVLVDASDFILQDIHGVSRKLKKQKQGDFTLEKSRSAIYLPRTKSFPDNTELEASITFTGNNPGKYVKQAAIDPNILSLRMHHSFIRLPKDGFKPRKFHPQSGFWSFDYEDYAQAINQPITQRFIPRHRLAKKTPLAKMSEAVEPIIYYLDPGAPEPVKTALLTGARWWNQAFETIGYKDAFQVKMLPEDADPQDVRYNVIQWVHRATRGWSYGYSVADPRTGEIIKGHVTLGSLRVRQDYLIAQGLLSKFTDTENDTELMNLALARIRQLSAHEVGHTLGIAHNFAASTYNRASVMDYPHPLFEIDKTTNSVTANNAYAEDIGVWDKAVIEYGYQTYPSQNEASSLANVIERNSKQNMLFISDPDSRNIGDAHPQASLWDNGSNTIDELERIINIRSLALSKFGSATLHSGRPYSDLQEILVPVYYFHRYQATAAAKWLGGIDYTYQLKEDANTNKAFSFADSKQQQRALNALLKTLSPNFLTLNKNIADIIPPKAYGHYLSRESLQGNTGKLFDQTALASASIQHTLSLLLEPTRLARLIQQHALDDNYMSISELGNSLHSTIVKKKTSDIEWVIQSTAIDLLYSNYINLIHNSKVPTQVKVAVYGLLLKQQAYLTKKVKKTKSSSSAYAFYKYQLSRIKDVKIENVDKTKLIALPKMPPGSPI
jgi:hypothetical protein